jgi:hypothetical protein
MSSTQLSKICIVIPYFGAWPFWIAFFLASCRANPTIDWLIYTDCDKLQDCPANVQVIYLSYADYCQKVSTSLSISFHPANAYKLCDIRPAYGQIHVDDLKGYDFWAFGDLDLVYGNLRRYFHEARLAAKDVFSTHATRTSGHLCLVRNAPDLISAYKKIANWKEKFMQEGHLAIDEKDFSKLFLRHKNSPSWLKKLAQLQDPWLTRAEFIEAYSTPNGRISWMDGSNNFPKSWRWQLGELSCAGENDHNFPYFHFLFWKKGWAQQAISEVLAKGLTQSQIVDFTITADGFQ